MQQLITHLPSVASLQLKIFSAPIFTSFKTLCSSEVSEQFHAVIIISEPS